MTARYWYRDTEGTMIGMEWRPMVEEDEQLPDEEAIDEQPDEPEQPDIEQPMTDPVEE